MRTHLIKEKTVWDYAIEHASSLTSFARWLDLIKSSDIEKPRDFIELFGQSNVDLLGENSHRICFDIGGNHHRVICSYFINKKSGTTTVFIKWIGTHSEYTKLCAHNKQYTVDSF